MFADRICTPVMTHLNPLPTFASHIASHLLTCIGICVRDAIVMHATHESDIAPLPPGTLNIQ